MNSWDDENFVAAIKKSGRKKIVLSGLWTETCVALPTNQPSGITGNILLGTDWPMLRYDRLVEELPLLELDDTAYEAYVRENATRIIKRVWPEARLPSESTEVSGNA